MPVILPTRVKRRGALTYGKSKVPIIRPTRGSRYQIRRCGRATFLRRGVESARLARDVFRAVEDLRLSTKSPFVHCRGALLGSDEWRHTVTYIIFNHAQMLLFCAIFWRSFVE
jgi:hypothetical protein